MEHKYINYNYKKIKSNNIFEFNCFIKNDKKRYYKIKILSDMTKTELIRKILKIENYPNYTKNFIIDIKKSDIKNVYSYKIYSSFNMNIECHLKLKQINENNFIYQNNKLPLNYFDDTYYFDISFIDIYIENNNNKQSLIIYFKIDSSNCLFEIFDDDFWKHIEKFIYIFSNLFTKK